MLVYVLASESTVTLFFPPKPSRYSYNENGVLFWLLSVTGPHFSSTGTLGGRRDVRKSIKFGCHVETLNCQSITDCS